MKRIPPIWAISLLLLPMVESVSGQEEVTIVTPTVAAAEGLDLKAVSELFSTSEDLEAFEKALNDRAKEMNTSPT